MNVTTAKIYLVVALPCEAKPLVDYYKLKKIISISAFAVFCNAMENIYLIVSGIGKIKAAAASSFLQQFSGNPFHAFFCNIGVAGSANYSIGELIVAHKITDQSCGINFYPFLGYLKNIIQTSLITHDTAQANYPTQGMVDMEASGFFQSANLFVPKEHIQTLKIISDNDQLSLQQINRQQVETLIHNQLANIDSILQTLLTLSQQESIIKRQPLYLNEFLDTWHFTKFQQQQLQDYLRRFEIKQQNPYHLCSNFTNAKEVLQMLSSNLLYIP